MPSFHSAGTLPVDHTLVMTLCKASLIGFTAPFRRIIPRQCLWCCHPGRVIARVHPVHLVNVERRQATADPKLSHDRCTQKAQTSAKVAAVSRRSAVAPSCESAYHVVSGNVEKSGRVILDSQPHTDQHQNLITSRGSTSAHAHHIWLTSVTSCS